MPVGFSSAARNLFLLGSSGADSVTNFFKAIDTSSNPSEGQFLTSQIKYNYSDQKFLLSGTGLGNDSFGWVEKRDYDGENETSTEEWEFRINPTVYSSALTLTTIELDSNNDIIVVGKAGGVNGDYGVVAPYIAKYSNAGVLEWSSTSYTGDVEYTGVTSDSNGNYYACGNTPDTQITSTVTGVAVAFVEKFDSNGNPAWGKSALMLGRDAVLTKIASNSRGEVVAVGYLEDDSANKGYIVKIDSSTGEVLWDRTIKSQHDPDGANPYQDVECKDIFIDSNGQIYIVGNKFNHGFIIKYTAEGNIIWQKQTDEGLFNSFTFDQVFSDSETEQVVVFGTNAAGLGTKNGLLSKYSKNGDLVWRRFLESSRDSGFQFDNVSLDADPSFYYLLFNDKGLAGQNPTTYTFGKVSSSGNGLGDFEYSSDGSTTIDYEILNAPDQIGRLSDGSVTNNSSDLVTYPFTANKIVFDDLATHVSNKKRQMDSADSFEYSGSPAIRPADFQELNLLGDVYSGSGDWLDQSGKGNDATTSFTTTTTTSTGGTTSSENFGTGGSITYNTYGTVAEGVTATLPYSTSDWDHYDGKVRDLQSGGFKITTSNAATTDFFMGCWVKFETYQQSRQMGINLGGNYIYWETLVSGKVAIRHNGGSRQDSANGTGIDDGNWHYISLSRAGSTLAGHVDGTPVITTTNGVSGNSVPSNADFWFFGGSGTSYNIDGKILDPIINIGTGQTGGYTTPSKPIIDSSGNFNDGSAGTGPFYNFDWNYASPAIALSGSTTTTTTTNGPTYNTDGYWEFDDAGDNIEIGTLGYDYSQLITLEAWIKTTDTDTWNQIVCGEAGDILWAVNQGKLNFGSQTNTPIPHNNQSTASINTGNWVHVLTTFDGANIKHYINGELDSTFAETGSLNANEGTHPLRIGARGTGTGEFYGGEIGEVRIYPRALTPAQVFQNYNATKSKYINEAPSTAPRITSGIVTNSNLLLNYDFGNRATYDDTQNYLVDNFASDTDTGEYFTDQYGKHKIYEANTNLNSIYGGSPFFSTSSSDTFDVSVSMWMKALDTQTNRFALLNGSGAPVTNTYSFVPKIENPDGGIISYTWTNVTISGNWNFVLSNSNGNARTMQYAKPQLTLKSSVGRYVKANTGVIAPPTTVKNLSSTSNTGGVISSVEFNPDGWMDFSGTNSQIVVDSNLVGSGLIATGDANSEYTLEAWIYVRTSAGGTTDSDAIMGHTSDRGVGFQVGISGGSPRINYGARFTSNFYGPTFNYNEWRHIVLTRDGTDGPIAYENNTQVGSLSDIDLDIESGFTIGDFNLGYCQPRITGRFDGLIGEARVYNTALSADEVSQNFNATRSKYGV